LEVISFQKEQQKPSKAVTSSERSSNSFVWTLKKAAGIWQLFYF
jgi:hypothetical protein